MTCDTDTGPCACGAWHCSRPARLASASAPESNRRTVLNEADQITAEDRQRYYGHPADNHGNTAALWSAYLRRRFGVEVELTARDVCLMMVLLKVSRDANRVNRDNLVDICGYARNAEMIEERAADAA